MTKEIIRQAAIIHPGAIGDCILILPLAHYLKETLGYHKIDLIAHADYVGFYPDRTPIGQIRSIESLDLHRLFMGQHEFKVNQKDSLIDMFEPYEHIISFLGTDHEHFEQNLLFAIHCSHSAEVTMMPMAGPKDQHISLFYIREFIRQNSLETSASSTLTNIWITATSQDMAAGTDILWRCGIGPQDSVCLIQPGSGSETKCWPLEHFSAITELIVSHQIKPVFLLGPAEMERWSKQVQNQLQNAAGLLCGLPLESVLGVLSCADYYIGNDSGISHLAAAMGKKTISLFGPSNSVQYRPLGPNVYVIQTTNTDFTNPSPDTRKWAQRCIEDIISGAETQKHLTQTDNSL